MQKGMWGSLFALAAIGYGEPSAANDKDIRVDEPDLRFEVRNSGPAIERSTLDHV